jgi:methyl-accepting chemotaxis protein
MDVTAWTRSVRIGPRLAIGFLVVLFFAGLAAAVAAWSLGTLGATIDRLVNEEATRLALAGELEKHIETNLVRSHSVLMFSDEVIAKRLQQDVVATAAELQRVRKQVDAVTPPGDGRKLLDAVSAAGARYEEKLKSLMERKSYGDDMNSLIRTELVPIAKNYGDAVQAFVSLQKASLEAARKDAQQTVTRTRSIVVALLGAGLIAAILAAAVLARSIVSPMKSARDSTQRIVSGDLTGSFVPDGNDELTDLESSLAQMQQSLRDIASELREAGLMVLNGSAEIATGNANLSQRTDEQSSTLEETAASLEELASTVKQNAESARVANEQAGSASRVAGEAGKLVNQVVVTMAEIQASARQIADISGVVNTIAFQTNLLALNAAVEAARAGTEGRGFAVVAAEVRLLAHRCADAAKEIQALVGASVERIDGGSRLVGEAGTTMSQVVASVSGVTQSIAHIAQATEEQNAGIAQVSQAMNNLETVTQHNASLVAQSATAAEGLRHQASRLQQSAAFFKLDDSDSAPKPAMLQQERREPTMREPAPAEETTRVVQREELGAPRAAPAPAPKVAALPDEEWEEF